MAAHTPLWIFCIIFLARWTSGTHPNEYHLYISALVGINNVSVLQCWKIEPSMEQRDPPTGIGMRFEQYLGNSTNSTLVYFTRKSCTNSGLHHAPAPQWLFVLRGIGFVKLPNKKESVRLFPGSVLVAADTPDVSDEGHYTTWAPGSIALQQPFEDGNMPNHTVVHDGACTRNELRVDFPDVDLDGSWEGVMEEEIQSRMSLPPD